MLLQRSRVIFLVAWLAATALYFLNLYYYPIISSDAALYLLTAKVFLTQGLKATFTAYSWPFHSILIALLSQLTGMSLLHAALTEVYCYFVLTVIVFVAILKKLGFSNKQLWLGLFVILAFHYFTRFSHNTIRDNGYFLFYLLSIYLFLCFLNTRTWLKALLWGASSTVAVLFRTEGVSFLLLTPLVIFLLPGLQFKQRCLAATKLYILPIILVASVFIVYITKVLPLHFLSRVDVIYQNLHFFSSFQQVVSAMKQHVVARPMADQVPAMLLIAFIGIYFKIFIEGFGLANLICFVTAFLKNNLSRSQSRVWLVVLTYMLVNILATLVFMFHATFLVDRYLMALYLTCLMFVPLGLIDLFQRWKAVNKSWRSVWTYLFYAAVLAFSVSVVGTLFHIGPSKRYIKQSANWINHNTQTNARIYTNYHKLLFYINRQLEGAYCEFPPVASGKLYQDKVKNCFSWDRLKDHLWQNSDYLVIEMDKKPNKEQALIKAVGHSPIKVFVENRKDKEVMIFHLKQA